jgi:UDP-N-acetylglucosamine acyltransferase
MEQTDGALIDPTAVIHPGAVLGADVRVGPFAVIERDVHIGARTEIGPHAVICRYTRIGEAVRIHPHAVIGNVPQDISFKGGETWAEIGDRTVIREGVTVNRSTSPGRPTTVGAGVLLMAYVHVAHDCTVCDRVILANNTALGGHVRVGEAAVVGGDVVVHQFCRVGQLAMVAGQIAVRQDVIPFTLVAGCPVRHYRLNTVGLRRAGVTGPRYRALEHLFRALRAGEKAAAVQTEETPEVAIVKSFLSEPTRRGIYRFAHAKSHGGGEAD